MTIGKKNPLLGTDWEQDLGRTQFINSLINNTPLSKSQNLNAVITSLMNPNRPTKALLEFALRERNRTQQQSISTMMVLLISVMVMLLPLKMESHLLFRIQEGRIHQ